MQKVIAVFCAEPMREGECAAGARVGYDLVTRIEMREQNLGTYGIQWLDVYRGDSLIESYNALNIAWIEYAIEHEGKE